MQCRDCPYSMACMSGRLDRGFVMVGLCPECARLYGIVDKGLEEQRRAKRLDAAMQKRIDEAKQHGIDLDYERHAELEFQQEYLGVFVPAPRTTVVMFRCELRLVTRAIRQRWRRTSEEVHGQYRYTSGWTMVDPADLLLDPLNIRPCPECVRWPDYHYIEDLDEKAQYEVEQARNRPAFQLNYKRKRRR